MAEILSASAPHLVVLQQLLKMVTSNSGWSFDVSALMVLIGEAEESKYRLMERSLLECLSPAPVVGLQCYLRSYGWLLDCSNLTYSSPLGCKSAPLRNMRLANAIQSERLLDDSKTIVYQIPVGSDTRRWKSCRIVIVAWFVVSWILFLGILLVIFQVPSVTWISKTDCICFCAWSIFLRLVEHDRVRPQPNISQVSRANDPDAIYILGRRDSCFILEGSRGDVKNWTACGLHFLGSTQRDGLFQNRVAVFLQAFTQVGSFLVLLLIFSTIPNGTTMDQMAFILFNILGQINTLLGQRFNGRRLLSSLQQVECMSTDSRTAVFAFLLRRFSVHDGGTSWAKAAKLVPKTEIWQRWQDQVVKDMDKDPKELYDIISDEVIAEKNPPIVNDTTSNED
jgi:hypothetical protein